MLREKVVERQFKAIKKSGKDMKTLDFVKDGYHYFGNGFQMVKVASTMEDKNVKQFEVVKSIFEEVETEYKNSVNINLSDLWCVFKGLKNSKLCEDGITFNFDGNGKLTIENHSNKFTPKIQIKMSYDGDGTKWNVLLSVNHVYDILNALTSLSSTKRDIEMFFDPLNELKPVLFYGNSLTSYEVVQPVMRKF